MQCLIVKGVLKVCDDYFVVCSRETFKGAKSVVLRSCYVFLSCLNIVNL